MDYIQGIFTCFSPRSSKLIRDESLFFPRQKCDVCPILKGHLCLSQTKMNKCFKPLAFVLLLTATASNGDKCPFGPNSEGCTHVVNHSFCQKNLPPEDVKSKKSLEEVHTYAKLKLDPRSNLPGAFTICSTIMMTNCQSYLYPIFFTFLDDQLDQIMAAYLEPSIESRMQVIFSKWPTSSVHNKIPPTFPNRWIKSCMAINSTSGSLDWVVEGESVLKYENVSELRRLPKVLSNKLVLGAYSYGDRWYSVSNKVTNLNIFSSFLTSKKLASLTSSGKCAEEGDYLAWRDMKWILHG